MTLQKLTLQKFDMTIRCIYEIKVKNEALSFEFNNNRDLKFYILSENLLEAPLYVLFELRSNQSNSFVNTFFYKVTCNILTFLAQNLRQKLHEMCSVALLESRLFRLL